MAQISTIETAVRFGEIPFTDFTKELITGTFDAIVDANLRQMEAYVDMVQILTKDLSTYINDTKNDISLAEIQSLVESLNLPADDASTGTSNLINGITQGYNEAINNETAPTGNNNVPAAPDSPIAQIINSLSPIVRDVVNGLLDNDSTSGEIDLNSTTSAEITNFYGSTLAAGTKWYTVMYEALAGKIANDKFTLLQNMAKMGMLRLVVDSGKIETRITFSTYESHLDESQSTHSDKNKERVKQVSRPPFVLGLFKKREKDKYNKKEVTINTAKDIHRDVSGSSVQIFGSVVINFKTDYLPLSTAG
ncbi:MAG: hypothetical protein KDC70_07470 [Saprospiraceae bacterium]|nr:hypothetical protein [Saprospiraceae bacterium]